MRLLKILRGALPRHEIGMCEFWRCTCICVNITNGNIRIKNDLPRSNYETKRHNFRTISIQILNKNIN